MFGEQADQRGLAQRLDEGLYRLESWRPVDRSTAVRIFCGMAVVALGIGWWFGRSEATTPVEDLIPVAAADVPDRSGAPAALAAPVSDNIPAGTAAADGAPASSAGEVTAADTEASVPADAPLIIHVIGAVVRPGLVSVPAGSRVDDVVAAAGGAASDAAIDRLNLAAPVSDGMQIRVPAVDDDVGEPLMIPASPNAGSGAEPETAGAAAVAGPVNLNTATAEELDTLPGIGPATAAAIMRWREDNGGFYSPEDLLSVPGIGQAKLAAVRDLVTV